MACPRALSAFIIFTADPEITCRQWAWGQDELRPESKQGLQWLRLGLTNVDSLVGSCWRCDSSIPTDQRAAMLQSMFRLNRGSIKAVGEQLFAIDFRRTRCF